MQNRNYQIRRSILEQRKRNASKRRFVGKQSVFKNIILVVIGLAIGCAIGPKAAYATPGGELIPQPFYKVIIGPAELEELQRRIQEMEYLYTQAMTMKKMIETKDWLGIGRSIGDPKLTGLIDTLEPAIKLGKEALQDMQSLDPQRYLNRDNYKSAEEYFKALGEATKKSKIGQKDILALMTERYADTVLDASGKLKTKHTQGSLPYFVDYQREALNAIQKTMAQMTTEDEGSLAKLLLINNQILMNQSSMMTQLLDAVADQNRILSIMAGNNIEVIQ
mgnify:FL=1|jgi:hypothetical protein